MTIDIGCQTIFDRMTPFNMTSFISECMTIWDEPCMTIWHPLSAIYWSDDTMYDNMTSFIFKFILYHSDDTMYDNMTSSAIYWSDDTMYDNMTSFISNISDDRMTPCMTIWHPLSAIYWSDDTMYDNMTSFASNILIGWHHVWQYDILYQQYIDRMTPCMTIWHPLSAIYWSDDTMYDNMTSFISNILIGWHHVWQYDILYQQYIDRMTPCMTIWHPLPAI